MTEPRLIRACTVEIMEAGGICGDVPAYPYTARCGNGHVLDEGHACEPCMAARTLGCLSCWRESGAVVALIFEPGLCHCNCGQMAGLAGKTNSRDAVYRGRPLRYVRGHQPPWRRRAL